MPDRARPLNVLIVEDSRADAELLLLELRRGGYQLTHERVETAAAMNAAFDRTSWDIVIADYSLPHFSAPAALALMQARGLDLPFIIVSGTVGEDVAVAALKAGAHDYIMKGQWARLAPAVERELREATERLARRQAERALQRRAAELAALYETTLDITRPYALPILLQQIVERAAQLLGAPGGALYLNDPDRREVRCVVSYGRIRDYTGLIIPHGEGVSGVVAQSGQPLTVDDYDSWPSHLAVYSDARAFASIVGAPLMWEGQVTGVVTLAHEQPGRFGRADQDLLMMFANQAAIAVEKARLYDEIRRHAADLEQRVVERTAELTAANARLQELDQLKSKFVSNVSHELRTPLTNIKSYLYLLDHGKPEKREHYMVTLQRETDLLQRLIEDLLDTSRIDAGKIRLELIPLDVNGLVKMLVEDRSRLLEERGLVLQLGLLPELPPVLADAKRIGQVFTNLMTNAMSYTPAGGIITVRTRLEPGSAGAEEQGGEGGTEHATRSPHSLHRDMWITFSVSDTGPGIAAEELPHIFERFFRGRAARKMTAPGTGLGLAISQELVARHRGRITVHSVEGQGSTFTVWLPAVAGETSDNDARPMETIS